MTSSKTKYSISLFIGVSFFFTCVTINANTCIRFYGKTEITKEKTINSILMINNYGFFSDAFNKSLPDGLYVYLINIQGQILISPRTVIFNKEVKMIGHNSLLNRLSHLDFSTEIIAAGEFLFENQSINYLNNKSGTFKKNSNSLSIAEKAFKNDMVLNKFLSSKLETQDYSQLLSLTEHPLYVKNNFLDPAHTISISELIGKVLLEQIIKSDSDILNKIKLAINDLKINSSALSPFLETQILTGNYIDSKDFETVIKLLNQIGYFPNDADFLKFVSNENGYHLFKGNQNISFFIKYCDFSLYVKDEDGKIIQKPIRIYTTSSIHLDIETAVSQAFSSGNFLRYKEKGAIGVKISRGGKIRYTKALVKGKDYKGDVPNISSHKLKFINL